MHDRLREQVLKTIRHYDMINPGDSILVAVSGGADSVYLLRALLDLSRKLGAGPVTACTLDHGLRGRESRADAAVMPSFPSCLPPVAFRGTRG